MIAQSPGACGFDDQVGFSCEKGMPIGDDRGGQVRAVLCLAGEDRTHLAIARLAGGDGPDDQFGNAACSDHSDAIAGGIVLRLGSIVFHL